jgi:MinD-like ATPase involved in chromosome partitioning or flagellar assembly
MGTILDRGQRRAGARRPPASPGQVWRLVVGLSASLEARLHDQLAVPTDDARCWSFATVRRCTSYAELEAGLEATAAEVVLLSGDVHGFRPRLVGDLAERLPLVLLLDRPDAFDAGRPLPATCVVRSAASSAAEVRLALAEAVDGGQRQASVVTHRRSAPIGAPTAVEPKGHPTRFGTTLVIVGEDRADRYALAVNLAAELGRAAPRPWWRGGGTARGAAPTVVVDGDLARPGLAAALALNSARNLSVVAGETDGGSDVLRWATSIRAQVQPIAATSPQAVALAGLPKPAALRSLSAGFLVELAAQLRLQFAWTLMVVGELDAGTATGDEHRGVAEAAERVFVVSRPNAVALAAAATTLEQLGVPVDGEVLARARGVELVLTGHMPGLHPHPAEIAVALNIPVAGVIPDDRRLAAALADQRPLVDGARRRGAAGRAVAQLAARLAGTAVSVQTEAEA